MTNNTSQNLNNNVITDCGGGVIDHHLLEAGFPPSAKLGNHLKADDDLTQLHQAATKAQAVVTAWGEKTQSSVRFFSVSSSSAVVHLPKILVCEVSRITC